jgi:hypothetical protein
MVVPRSGRYFGLHHKGGGSAAWKRAQDARP